MTNALSDRQRSLVAVIASMVVVNLVYGLTLPLLSLVLDGRGVSKSVIGLSIMAQACAGVVLSPVTPHLMARLGAARLMQLATVLAASTLMLLAFIPNLLAWFPLRFLLGASAAALWAASEAMINELAGDSWRGRIIGMYGAAGAAGFAIGPLVLVATGSQGILPFAVTAGLVILAGLPLLALKGGSGPSGDETPPGVWRIFARAPEIMLLNLTYAAAVEAFLAFFPLFGLEVGLSEARALSLLTVFGVGGVVLQLPLGWLADHMDRNRLLMLCLVSTVIGFALMPLLVSSKVLAPVYSFFLGGVEGMIYAMGVILLGQRFRGVDLASASVVFTGMWGAGMMIGPAAVGVGMDVLGPAAMPWLIAGLYALYLPVRLLARR